MTGSWLPVITPYKPYIPGIRTEAAAFSIAFITGAACWSTNITACGIKNQVVVAATRSGNVVNRSSSETYS